MTVIVKTSGPEQEKVLLAFLESLQYDYETDFDLSDEQQQEVLRREKEFAAGNITSRPWAEIKKDFEKVYR